MKRRTLIWLGLTLIISAVVIWSSLKFAKYDQAIRYIESRPSTQIIEKQPIFTTVQGLPGPKGDPGENSTSTHTTTEKETTIIKEVPITGEKGDKGESGQTLELAYDVDGTLLYRFIGDRFWQKVLPLSEVGNE
jgi:hypothetical protein